MGMSPLVQQLSEKLDQWKPEVSRKVESLVAEIMDLADAGALEQATQSRWVPKAELMRLLSTGRPDSRFFEDIAGLEENLENPWKK